MQACFSGSLSYNVQEINRLRFFSELHPHSLRFKINIFSSIRHNQSIKEHLTQISLSLIIANSFSGSGFY